AEDLKQVVKARAGGIASNGKTHRMHERSDLETELRRADLERGFDRSGIEIFELCKGGTHGFETRFAFETGMFRDALGAKGDFVGKIKSGIRRELAKNA